MNPALTNDEDLEALFDMVVDRLREHFDYSAESAESVTREYYRLFQDPEYCKSIGVAVQDDEFFFHEAPGGLALRVHYYLTLAGDPDPGSFIEWRTRYYEDLRGAHNKS